MAKEGFETPRVYRVKKNFMCNFGRNNICEFKEGSQIQLYADGILVEGLPLPPEYSQMFEAFVRDKKKSSQVLDLIVVKDY